MHFRWISLGLALAWVGVITAQQAAPKPETVMVTLLAKPGSEAALAKVLDRHWETARKLNLVRESSHLAYSGSNAPGTTFFVEIFTWRDGNIPDHAPSEIQAIWAEMNQLVEARAGTPGLRFVELTER